MASIARTLRAAGINAGPHTAEVRSPVVVFDADGTSTVDIMDPDGAIRLYLYPNGGCGVVWHKTAGGASRHRSVWRFAQIYRRALETRAKQAASTLI